MSKKLSDEELLERLERIVRPAMDRLHYWENKDEQAYQQIREMIQKPGVTEKWIEEKARKLYEIVQLVGPCAKQWIEHDKDEFIFDFKDFIRSLVKEIQSR